LVEDKKKHILFKLTQRRIIGSLAEKCFKNPRNSSNSKKKLKIQRNNLKISEFFLNSENLLNSETGKILKTGKVLKTRKTLIKL
jgi:hypothetical protein